ncbi:hypothetical protein BGW80DRAFT_44045 [Lactifluus volemus]|nr:hypothetical protein BGW80DRAFT_44045 [Lactifluus volemus]
MRCFYVGARLGIRIGKRYRPGSHILICVTVLLRDVSASNCLRNMWFRWKVGTSHATRPGPCIAAIIRGDVGVLRLGDPR